ncbi:MAG: IPT/TIG domain-containing protein [Candidatus Sulfotelmatobacter sp.]
MKRFSAVLLAALTAFTLACGYSSKATTPAVAGTMPSIAELAPDSTNSGEPGFILTVNGSNFSTNATINWNGTAQTTTHVSANQLTATIAASDIETPASVPVTVTNPGTAGTGAYGSGGTLAETSSAMNFTVN